MEFDKEAIKPLLQTIISKDAIAFKSLFEEIMTGKVREVVASIKHGLHEEIFDVELTAEKN